MNLFLIYLNVSVTCMKAFVNLMNVFEMVMHANWLID